jgi:hypothetical protein
MIYSFKVYQTSSQYLMFKCRGIQIGVKLRQWGIKKSYHIKRPRRKVQRQEQILQDAASNQPQLQLDFAAWQSDMHFNPSMVDSIDTTTGELNPRMPDNVNSATGEFNPSMLSDLESTTGKLESFMLDSSMLDLSMLDNRESATGEIDSTAGGLDSTTGWFNYTLRDFNPITGDFSPTDQS